MGCPSRGRARRAPSRQAPYATTSAQKRTVSRPRHGVRLTPPGGSGCCIPYTFVTITMVLGFGAWSGMEAPRIEAGLATPWVGVKERHVWYAYQLWFIVLSLTLLRERTGETNGRT